jgi:hypothetical protein
VDIREALSDAVPEAQIVLANRVSDVLTNPAAYDDVEGPVLKAVVIPAFLVIDENGIVRSSELWNSTEAVTAEVEKLRAGGRDEAKEAGSAPQPEQHIS